MQILVNEDRRQIVTFGDLPPNINFVIRYKEDLMLMTKLRNPISIHNPKLAGQSFNAVTMDGWFANIENHHSVMLIQQISTLIEV